MPAHGWAKGESGCSSYGTHDWILDKAIGAASKKGRWVRVRVALRATDDPDCKDGIDHASGSSWHAYDEWGGADEATRVWFRRTKRRREAGRKRAASRTLGIMSHFIAEVANPMHTDQSDEEEAIHGPYEDDVDERIRTYPFRYGGRDAARPELRRVARVAHRSYWDLVNAYDAHGYNRKSTGSRNAS
jgi:hypothetical protein